MSIAAKHLVLVVGLIGSTGLYAEDSFEDKADLFAMSRPNPAYTIEMHNDTGEVLTIYNPAWGYGNYPRPKKPEDVVITLTTADGKRWNAQWVSE